MPRVTRLPLGGVSSRLLLLDLLLRVASPSAVLEGMQVRVYPSGLERTLGVLDLVVADL